MTRPTVTETVRNGHHIACGHARHVGTCCFCQQAQAQLHDQQLQDATAAKTAWQLNHHHTPQEARHAA